MNSLILNKSSISILKCSSTTTAAAISSRCNYTVLSQKKFDKIKNKRDKEAKLLKEEKEKFFSEQASVSVEDLEYPQVLTNVKEKYQKYGIISNNLVAALFRKSRTQEELYQSLAFYKTIGNKSSSFLKPAHKTYIFESFKKNNAIPLFSEILIHSDKFQIFPQMNVFVKCVADLLSNQEDEIVLAASLLSTYQLREADQKIPDSFLSTLGKTIDKAGATLKFIDLLNIYPVNLKLTVNSDMAKYIIRCAYTMDNKEEIYNALVKYTDKEKYQNYDDIVKSEYIAFEIISNHNLDTHQFSSESTSNDRIYNNLVQILKSILNNENASENTKNNINRSISNFTINPKLKSEFNL